ncbi:hypothetical protein [Streptomyces acidicola]|uniref:hypothetical protein n=1 Tax=Streptomyces acidicola TaxID=2596892 RepID=UPI003818723A
MRVRPPGARRRQDLPLPTADHISWRYTWDGGQRATGCLRQPHYPPESNSHFLSGAGTLTHVRWGTLTYVRWGGER